MAESPVEIVTRWEDHGAQWRTVQVSDERVVIDLCTCTGEPVERLDSSDPELIRLARERAG
jgi:hypothetical protein